jgi:hypothetical protein
MKPFRLGVFAVALVLAACTSSPTGTSADPAGPSYDGGASLGSGNSAGDGNVEGANTSSDSTTNERGGNTLGSGN